MKKAMLLCLHFPSNNSFLRINNNNDNNTSNNNNDNNTLLVEKLLLENLIFAQTVEKFPQFYRT